MLPLFKTHMALQSLLELVNLKFTGSPAAELLRNLILGGGVSRNNNLLRSESTQRFCHQALQSINEAALFHNLVMIVLHKKSLAGSGDSFPFPPFLLGSSAMMVEPCVFSQAF